MSQSDEGTARALYADQRNQHIVETLRRDGRVDATVVASVLSVTGETVRKDLVRFERQGLLRRVHGGAVPVTHLSNEPAVANPDGISQSEAAIKRRMPSCAHRCIPLADHSKVGAVSGVRCGEVSDVDLLITDVASTSRVSWS